MKQIVTRYTLKAPRKGLKSSKWKMILPRSQIEEEHTEKDEQEIECLAAQVLLTEEKGTAEERHQYAATAHHRDYRDERVWLRQGGEVGKVGHGEKHGDERYGPRPVERGALPALGVPQHQKHNAHDEELVDGKPRLHHHAIEPLHKELVVQGTHGTEQR